MQTNHVIQEDVTLTLSVLDVVSELPSRTAIDDNCWMEMQDIHLRRHKNT
jgi:hypothetical protein